MVSWKAKRQSAMNLDTFSTMNECWCGFGKLITNILHIEQLYIMTCCSLRTLSQSNSHLNIPTHTNVHTHFHTITIIAHAHTRTIPSYTIHAHSLSLPFSSTHPHTLFPTRRQRTPKHVLGIPIKSIVYLAAASGKVWFVKYVDLFILQGGSQGVESLTWLHSCHRALMSTLHLLFISPFFHFFH